MFAHQFQVKLSGLLIAALVSTVFTFPDSMHADTAPPQRELKTFPCTIALIPQTYRLTKNGWSLNAPSNQRQGMLKRRDLQKAYSSGVLRRR